MHMRSRFPAVIAVAATLVSFSGDSVLAAGTFTVSNTFNSGAGTLRQSILDANAAGGGTININVGFSTISLQSLLPVLSSPITINGNNADISGAGIYRIFFSDGPSGSTTTINNLTLRDGRAVGGAGGLGGGGGGLGAGGGIFVARGNVVLNGVTMQNNSAVGGAGGNSLPYAATAVNGGGGGGGLGGFGGNAQDQSLHGGGGGGLYGAGAAPNGNSNGGRGGGSAPDGSSTEGGVGGTNQGFDGARYGGGGGGSYPGGNGGPFGGGGGSDIRGGNGGFGGGGGGGGDGNHGGGQFGLGADGGFGGFGGGGGGGGAAFATTGSGDTFSNPGLPGLGGAFGGRGSSPGNALPPQIAFPEDTGGGGGSLGANVFIAPGASISFADINLAAGTLIPGKGGTYGADGAAAGTSLFLAGPTRFGVSANQTRAFAGSIVDIGDYANDPTAFGFNFATFTKTGDGTLNLQSNNGYRGGTVVSQGNLVAQTAGAVGGGGAISINDEATGSSNTTLTIGSDSAGFDFNPPLTIRNLGTGVATLASSDVTGGSAAFIGSLTLERSVTLLGRNNTPQDNLDSTGQTRVDGAITGIGGITVSGGHMVQLRGANTYAGQTRITANTTLSIYTAEAASPNSAVTIDAGSTLKLESVFAGAKILSLDGAGTVRGGNAGISKLQLGSTVDAAVHTFTGSIPDTGYGIQFEKVGTDTFEIGAQTNRRLTLTVTNGAVRAGGDLLIYELDCYRAAAGPQSFDLNGHLIDVTQVEIPPFIVGDTFNANVGDASDGIYDSTNADARKAVGVAKSLTTNLYTVKTTWKGDANLDGAVDFSDLLSLAQNYGSTSTSKAWAVGDFDRDGNVSFSDLLALAQNYGVNSLSDVERASDAGEFAADWVLAQSLVPEPTSLFALPLFFVTRRLRR